MAFRIIFVMVLLGFDFFIGEQVRAQTKDVVALIHITDPQWTFSLSSARPKMDQLVDGALAVVGTELTHDSILKATRASLGHSGVKISLSGDAHFEEELSDPTQNGEFHAPFHFPPHGMQGRMGPDGDRLFAELEALLRGSPLIPIPAHHPVRGKLALVPFDLATVDLRKIEEILYFEKNGVGSYSVFVNPRYREYLQRMDPNKQLPHFHMGWCSDFCVYQAVKGELSLGYRAYVLVDAIAGVFPKKTGQALRDLAQSGARFMTTQEYVDLLTDWERQGLNTDEVGQSLRNWQEHSVTQKRVLRELTHPRYADPSPDEVESYGQCAVLLTPSEG